MNVASAYPGDVISAPMMAALIVVVVGGLAAWLILVYLADRQPKAKETRQAGTPTPVPAALDQADQDEQSEADLAQVAGRHEAAV